MIKANLYIILFKKKVGLWPRLNAFFAKLWIFSQLTINLFMSRSYRQSIYSLSVIVYRHVNRGVASGKQNIKGLSAYLNKQIRFFYIFRHYRFRSCGPILGKCPPPLSIFLVACLIVDPECSVGERVGIYCYTLYQNLSWSEANNACAKDGMIIHDGKDRYSIIQSERSVWKIYNFPRTILIVSEDNNVLIKKNRSKAVSSCVLR